MIRLTRLNGAAVHLNIDLIQTIESMPDTLLTLVNGDKLTVREPAEEVVRRFNGRRRRLGRRPPLVVVAREEEAL